MQRRENTFRIDYARIPRKPSYEELHHFVGEVLGMKREDVLRLQCSKYLACAFVKASSLEVAERVVRENDGKHEIEVDKKKYPLRLCMEDGGVDVKLHDLSEDVRDESIIEFMKQYGEIISIRELLWDSKYQFGQISTGIRVVRMVITKNIPTIVTIDSETTCTSYNGQLQTCKHCNELVHNGITCIQNKKLLLQKLQAEKSSFVSVVKQSATTNENASNKPRRSMLKPTAGQQPPKPGSSISRMPPTTPNELMPPPVFTKLPVPAIHAESEFPALCSKHHPTTNNHSQLRSDGHDTDSSTTSTSSRQLRSRAGKKMRPNEENFSNDEN